MSKFSVVAMDLGTLLSGIKKTFVLYCI